MFENLFSKISEFVKDFINIVVEIFTRVVSWLNDVVAWFKTKLHGCINKIAILMTVAKLRHTVGFGDMLENVRTVHISNLYGDDKFGDGLMEVVYDKNTDKVDEIRIIGGDGIDSKIKAVMKDVDILKLD